jgi:hypothetical protein
MYCAGCLPFESAGENSWKILFKNMRNFKVLLFYELSIRRNLTVEVSGSCYGKVLGSIKLVGPTPTFSEMVEISKCLILLNTT